jgi:hypothetical protein
MARKSTAADRWEGCVVLARDYGATAKAIAQATGLGVTPLAARLRRAGIDADGGGMVMKIRRTVLTQLRTVQAMLAEGAPDKARTDAMTSHVRALERVLELLAREEMRDAAPEGQGGLPPLDPAELAGVLMRIEMRIEELARERAAHLVEPDVDGQGGAGGGA